MGLNTRTVADVPMHAHERGAGLPLVLVPGIPPRPRLWRHVLPKIEGARRLTRKMAGYAGLIEALDVRDATAVARDLFAH